MTGSGELSCNCFQLLADTRPRPAGITLLTVNGGSWFLKKTEAPSYGPGSCRQAPGTKSLPSSSRLASHELQEADMRIITGAVKNKRWTMLLKSLLFAVLLVGLVGLLSGACGENEKPTPIPPPTQVQDPDKSRVDPAPQSTPVPPQTGVHATPSRPRTPPPLPTAAPLPTAQPLQHRNVTPMPAPTGAPAPAASGDYRLLRVESAAAESPQLAYRLADPEPYPLGAGGNGHRQRRTPMTWSSSSTTESTLSSTLKTTASPPSPWTLTRPPTPWLAGSLLDGYLPEPEAVRVEEFVNYFDHGYEPAGGGRLRHTRRGIALALRRPQSSAHAGEPKGQDHTRRRTPKTPV